MLEPDIEIISRRTRVSAPHLRSFLGLLSRSFCPLAATVGVRHLCQWQYLADDGPQMTFGDPRGKLLPCLVHQFAVRGEICQPQSVYARAFGIEQTT